MTLLPHIIFGVRDGVGVLDDDGVGDVDGVEDNTLGVPA